MRKDVSVFITALFIVLTIAIAGCGVKAPPLPPLAVTPQQSDLQRPSPEPSPAGVLPEISQ